MTILTRSVTADSAGAATVSFDQLPTGIQWLVWQTSVETIPQGVGVSAYITMNGRLVTSTPFGSSSAASGPPAITISPGDQFTVRWAGAPAGCSCVATILYDEVPYGYRPPTHIV
jgi:hypothetical protein